MSNRFALVTLVFLAVGPGSTAEEVQPERPAEPPPAPRASGPAPGVAMNNHYLDQTLRAFAEDIEGGEGRWLLTWYDVDMLVVSDEAADRMRVMALVDDAEALDRDQLQFLLEVNFDRALDAKYAIWQKQVWATFVHPLSWLTADELKAGMRQVISLNRTYGTEFSSTGMTFAPGLEEGGG